MATPSAIERERAVTGLGCLVAVARHHGHHLSVTELIEQNALPAGDITTLTLLDCAKRAGMRAKAVKLDWRALHRLDKALPIIIGLAAGGFMVLQRIEGSSEDARVVLIDPAHAGDEIAVDRIRFEAIWSGEAILLRPIYRFEDEEQPFGIRLIAALVFRERRLVRHIAISAVMLSLMALAPIMFWRLLTDKVIYYRGFSTFEVLCIGMGIVIVFEAIFAYLRSYLLLVLTARVDTKLSDYVFRKLLALPMDFFERTQVGVVMRDVNEIWRIRTFLTGQLFGTILDSLTLLIFIPVMLVYSPLLTVIVLAFCALIVGWLLAMLPLLRARTGAVMRAEGARGAFLVQTLQGMRTVKSLALEHTLANKWDAYIAEIARLKMAEGQVASLVSAVVRPLERLAVSASFAIGVYLAITTNDPVMIGGLYAFLMLSMRVSGPLLQMAQLVTQYDEARTAVALVSRLVNAPKEDARAGTGVRTVASGQVEFNDVQFKYQGASTLALDGVTFEVPEGTTLGIVGRSGSGKTTVTRLLQRLHTQYSGQIKIGGIDAREYDTHSLRRNLGVVLQENFLFSGTIRENIVAAKPGATYEEVVRAARLAGAEEFIDRLPRGYETYVYEGSPNLSGGQRQRLAIARSLILDPRIMILDEATSALDPESEAIVNANLNRISAGRTMVIVSHRLSSLVNTNATMVLERGRVLDVGRHDELLKRCAIYSSLWHQQNGHTLTMVGKPAPSGAKPREQARG